MLKSFTQNRGNSRNFIIYLAIQCGLYVQFVGEPSSTEHERVLNVKNSQVLGDEGRVAVEIKPCLLCGCEIELLQCFKRRLYETVVGVVALRIKHYESRMTYGEEAKPVGEISCRNQEWDASSSVQRYMGVATLEVLNIRCLGVQTS
eukprot:Gb_38341 [translate_table: standard]